MKTIDTTSMSNYTTGTLNYTTGTKTSDLVYRDAITTSSTSIPYEWIDDLKNATVTISSDRDVYVDYVRCYNGISNYNNKKKDTKNKKKKASTTVNVFEDLDIEKIEANSKKDTVTVFWKNNNFRKGSKYGTRGYTTTVHRMDGDADDMINAVAAAFCINKYRSNAQFKKVMRDKYGTDEIYEQVAIFEIVEHFGSIERVCEIIMDNMVWLYPEFYGNKNTKPINNEDLARAIRRGCDDMVQTIHNFSKSLEKKKRF